MSTTSTGAELDALLDRARREVDEGRLPSCQIALAKHGEVVVFEALGAASTSSRYPFYSATKAIVASAIWQLLGEGALRLDQRVAELIPEFASNGKDVITVEQVLTHTSGFPHAPLGPPKWAQRSARLEAFGRWRLNWEPGTAAEYHPTSAHWVLAELIERLRGDDYRAAVQRGITDPLGLPRILGIEAGDQSDIVEVEARGEEATPDELEATLGIRELPASEVDEAAILLLNDPEVRAVGIPGGGGFGTAATLALFYQGLLHNQGGLWNPAVLADATGKVHDNHRDRLLGVEANRGLGVVIAGDDGRAPLRGFGHAVSPWAFGHNGACGQIAWADPASGLSFCFLTNGYDRNVLRLGRRSIGLSSRAGACAARI